MKPKRVISDLCSMIKTFEGDCTIAKYLLCQQDETINRYVNIVGAKDVARCMLT